MRERVNEEVSKLEYCSPTGWLVGWLVQVVVIFMTIEMLMICSDDGNVWLMVDDDDDDVCRWMVFDVDELILS